MTMIKTIMIKRGEGTCLINECDYDETVHVLVTSTCTEVSYGKEEVEEEVSSDKEETGIGIGSNKSKPTHPNKDTSKARTPAKTAKRRQPAAAKDRG